MEIYEFVLRITVCFLLSFVLGIERQYRRRSLGLRTMILVSIGSFMFVSFSFLITSYETDVSRIAAQVVAGIGFLGAGVIIKDNEKNRISGLTTAATLWCDASIGILCAAGFLIEAGIGSAVVLFSNIVLRELNRIINNRATSLNTQERFGIILYKANSIELVQEITKYLNDKNYVIIDNYKVDEDKIYIELLMKKTFEKRLDGFILNIVEKYKIKKYECSKIEEHQLEENDEI